MTMSRLLTCCGGWMARRRRRAERNTAWRLPGLWLVVAALSGCGDPWTPVEQRINDAVPPGAQAQRSIDAVRALAAGHPRAVQIETEVAFRLKTRARSCTHGYTPTLFSDSTDIRDALMRDPGCLQTADAELAERLGMLWVGLTLAQPPLRPVPQGNSLSHLEAEATVVDARFARDAGVAVLDVQRSLQIVDMDSGQRLLNLPRQDGPGHDGALSPNGRLVAVHAPPDATRVLDTQRGEVVLHLPNLRADRFVWLDGRTAYSVSPKGDQGWLFDFSQGRALRAPVADRVVRAPEGDDQYVMFGPQSVVRVQFVRIGSEAGARVLLERPSVPTAADPALAGVTADGRRAFAIDGALRITALDSLSTQVIDLEPFRASHVVATPDPDQILLMGAMAGDAEHPVHFVYRLSTQKAAIIELGPLTPTRYAYIASLRRLGLLAGSRLSLGHSLPVGPEMPLARLRALGQTPGALAVAEEPPEPPPPPRRGNPVRHRLSR